MSMNAPKKTTWIVALVLGAVGIVASLVHIPVISGFAFWLLVAGFVVLAVATTVRGL